MNNSGDATLMELVNTRTGQRVTVKEARSVWEKCKGLMFSLPCALLMIFRKPAQISLHTFFVFFPLRIFYLNEKFCVVEKKDMKPWTYYAPEKKAAYILEVPATISFHADIGDYVRMKISRDNER